MPSQQFEVHPAANVFPMMTEEEFQGLKADIAENGQRRDIVVWCGKLIDGRNRLRACEELQIEPDIAELDPEHCPYAYIISHNFHRRNLTLGQRAMVLTKMADLQHGGDRGNRYTGGKCAKSSKTPKGVLLEDAVKALNVSKKTVERAKQVRDRGSEAVQQSVEQGEIPVTLAAELVKAVPDKKEQTKLVKQGKQAVREAVKAKEPEATHKGGGARLEEVKKIWWRCSDEEKDEIRDWVNDRV